MRFLCFLDSAGLELVEAPSTGGICCKDLDDAVPDDSGDSMQQTVTLPKGSSRHNGDGQVILGRSLDVGVRVAIFLPASATVVWRTGGLLWSTNGADVFGRTNIAAPEMPRVVTSHHQRLSSMHSTHKACLTVT